jgi:hypothetical protein
MALRRFNNLYIAKQFFSDEVFLEERFVIGKETSNAKIVNVKRQRKCFNCLSGIKANSSCYTFNPYKKPRYWVCLNCLPKPNGKPLLKTVGEEGLYYCEGLDNLGNRMDYNTLVNHNLEDFWLGDLEKKHLSDSYGIGQD